MSLFCEPFRYEICRFANVYSDSYGGAIYCENSNLYVDKSVADTCYSTCENSGYNNLNKQDINKGQFIHAEKGGRCILNRTTITNCAPNDKLGYFPQRPLHFQVVHSLKLNTINLSGNHLTWGSGFALEGTLESARYINIDSSSSNMVAIELVNAPQTTLEYVYLSNIDQQCSANACNLGLLYFTNSQARFNNVFITNLPQNYLIYKPNDQSSSCTFNNYKLYEGAKIDGITLETEAASIEQNSRNYITEEERLRLLGLLEPSTSTSTSTSSEETTSSSTTTSSEEITSSSTTTSSEETTSSSTTTSSEETSSSSTTSSEETTSSSSTTSSEETTSSSSTSSEINPDPNIPTPLPEKPSEQTPSQTQIATKGPDSNTDPKNNQNEKISGLPKNTFIAVIVSVIVAVIIIIAIVVFLIVRRAKNKPHDVTSSDSPSLEDEDFNAPTPEAEIDGLVINL
ncbi:hypothetical protein TVAG_204990 [Trichomonas vaginalis G3]|uniref:Uncharacterized protein n=1 Tax=Trichomonas vaginalis (strain ATCC PRA-98 / G3) TaxID=412133 RepID=A2EJ01_TRIV3|nr:paired immunoglobulin-like type 2 receptor family [Trichomonas vaginalis G3]EAY07391.1 hypothetical protein TVAG_204990 [Trichomonas vaginalis G3]KAI5506544.1 paired immunoglobulin-like type 2 receptor family [Trichomonas vaginalis G3]|eukprot:XP_001319614.1 hypothetical protein [Trichomonas vaginalis G3]